MRADIADRVLAIGGSGRAQRFNGGGQFGKVSQQLEEVRHEAVIGLHQPIFQHEGRDAHAVQPARHRHAFTLDRQHVEAAAGRDDHRSAGRDRRIGKIGGERCVGDVAHDLAEGEAALGHLGL